MSFQNQLEILINANTRLVEIVSYEILRVHAEVSHIAKSVNRPWYAWDCIQGLRKWDNKTSNFEVIDGDCTQAGELLDNIISTEENNDLAADAIIIAEDFHPFITEGDWKNIRRLRILTQAQGKRTLLLALPWKCIPEELAKEISILDLPLPEVGELEAIFNKVCNDYSLEYGSPPERLIQSALGLTIMEAGTAFSKAAVTKKQLTDEEVPFIVAEKESVIKKSGYLEYYHPLETMNDIGGLDRLKTWLKKRGRAFHKEAVEYGLEPPRGLLLLGIPGTGKSLAAKAIGNAWQLPLLKLDMGKVFGGIVGESERNMRNALEIAEALAPSVLWVDEIEKGLSGMQSSGSTDGGTTSRVMGTFLNWMQERKKPVFVVATANNISQLPPEMLRKGRVDEIFFVDLPAAISRKDILSIHLRKRKRDPNSFDLEKLSEISIGFSGAELEEAIKEALFQSFDEGIQIETKHIESAIKQTFPLSKTMHEVISNLRKWAKARAVMASSDEPVVTEDNKSTDNLPVLKQEKYNNPFME